MVFWRAVLPHCRKIFGASGDAPSKFSPNEFGAQEKSVINHWLKPVAWAEKS
jgi:hypothetical protein